MALNKNMSLWNTVSKTNPSLTKEVEFGRKFTAIDPHSQIMSATEQFGPVGQGWGWEVVKEIFTPTNDFIVLVRLWAGTRENFYEQWGQASLYIDKKDTRKDKDFAKKATTDAITKCLSYLGFNADVFLGKFDDSKYVQEMEQEFKPKAPVISKDLVGKVNDLAKAYKDANDIAQIDQLTNEHKELFASVKPFEEQTNQLRREYASAKKRVQSNDNPQPQAA